MIKRLYKNLSFLLVAFLLFTSLPTVALAADDDNEDGSAVVSSSSEEQSSEVPEDEMVVELEDEDASSESSDVTESIAESTEDANVLESSLDINIESEETDIDTDLIDESDIDVDTITEDVAESDVYEQDIFDDYTLSGAQGSISDFDITITDVRGSQYTSRLKGNDGTPKLLIFGGISSCGQTDMVVDFIIRLYGKLDGDLDIYLFDIKDNSVSDIVDFVDYFNTSKDIRVASVEWGVYNSPTYSLYRRCNSAAGTNGSYTMPLMAYIDGSGNILHTSTGEQYDYPIIYRIENDLKVKVRDKKEIISLSATEFPSTYSIDIPYMESTEHSVRCYPAWCSMTPAKTGNYTFEFKATGGSTPSVYVYENGNIVNRAFRVSQLTQKLEAGKEYIFVIVSRYYHYENSKFTSITWDMTVSTDVVITPFDPAYKGIIKDDKSGKWYYVKDGYVDTSFNGFAKNESNGKTYYVKNGEIDWKCTSLMKDASTGKWFYVQKGQVNYNYVGLAKNVANGRWYYVNNGAISWNFTGLAKNPANGHWYYVTKGEINWKYTGLAKNSANGNWYYVKNGEIDFSFTGIAKNEANGNYYYVNKGQLDWNFSGKYYDSRLKKTFTVTKGVAK